MWRILVLASFVSSTFGDNSYMLIVPRILRPGVPIDIAVNILNSTRDVHVRALLFKDNSYDLVLNADGNFQEGEAGTLTLDVPSIDRLPSSAKHFTLAIHGSGGLTFNDQTYLSYQKKDISVFVQTDKAQYKPGQTVHFRVVAVYSNMTIYDGEVDIVIRDSNSNKIKQWLGVRDESGVFESEMIMDTEPVMGDWSISVTAPGVDMEKSFEVAKYVLPKFEVKFDLPENALTSDTDIQGKVTATYTYGKPVKGNGTLTVRLDYYFAQWGFDGNEIISQQTFNITGEESFTIPLDVIHQLLPRSYEPLSNRLPGHNLIFEVNVTEEVNQITIDETKRVEFVTDGHQLTFLPSSLSVFKPGLPYRAHIKLGYHDGRPIVEPRAEVTLKTYVTYHLFYDPKQPERYYPKVYSLPVSTYTVPASGVIDAAVKIPDNATNVRLEATYESVTTQKDLVVSPSPSGSYIHLELKSSAVQLKTGREISFEVKSTKPLSVLMYQVISRGSTVLTGFFDGALSKAAEFSFVVTKAMGPKAHVIVYYTREDEEIVADGVEISIEDIFENQVTIGFDKSSAEPGETVNINIKTSPQSVVSLLAVDQSVLLLKSGNDITQSMVTDELLTYTPENYYQWSCSQGSPECIFREAGVWVLTDVTNFTTPNYESFRPRQECRVQREKMGRSNRNFEDDMDMSFGGTASAGFSGPRAMPQQASQIRFAQSAPLSSPPEPLKSRVRKEFPETWLWINRTTGPDGSVSVSVTAPDTITSWVASAFAVNRVSGLGIADTKAKLKTFRSFFVSLNLPYAVVRGEDLALQAVVFNYLKEDLHVAVTLEKSGDDFVNLDHIGKPTGSHDAMKRVLVKAGEAKSVYFAILPTTIGKIDISVKARSALAMDAVQRQLLVESEGLAQEFNIPVFIDLRNSSQFAEVVPVTLPSGRVDGSEKMRLTAMGDIMGPSIKGLSNLLSMPSGTGEQAMLKFAPNVYIADYLSATKQLTDEIKGKILRYLARGYQHELAYKHWDGSFSSFGERDGNGNTRLTALVLKSFTEAKRYVFIDEEVLENAEKWLLNQQSRDGSFRSRGGVDTQQMQVQQSFQKGGKGLESIQRPEPVAITAYILIALHTRYMSKEHSISPIPEPNAHKFARTYLERQLSGLNDVYELAITSYALALTDSSYAHMAMRKLNDKSILKDGKRFWHADEKQDLHRDRRSIWIPPHKKANPIDIEIASYALLTHAHNKDFASGRPVMKWLMGERNANGGFYSARDTVLGLEALSEFAKMSSDTVDMEATVTSNSFTHSFTINDENAMISQSVMPPNVPNSMNVTATGHGVGLVEAKLFFHIDQAIQNPAFNLTLDIIKESKNVLTIKICARWNEKGSTGLTVLELGILSGFEPDRNIKDMPSGLIKVEPKDKKLIFYFDRIDHVYPTCFTMDMYRVGMVGKSQPASVLMYDYNKPSSQATDFYHSELLKDESVCGLCANCC